MTDMRTRKKIPFLCVLILPGLGCGSLIGETDRIRMLYAQKNPVSVVATDPADNSIAPYNQAYIDVTLSAPVDTGTITVQSGFGVCGGSFQVSYDGFMNCLGGAIDATANPRIRFVPSVFPKGLGLQIKITADMKTDLPIAVTPYVSSVGFKLGAPCGNQNCFFSYSTPLMTNAGGSSGVFLVRGGVNQGKYLVYTQGQTTTTLIDPIAASSGVGPSMAGSCDGVPDHTPNQAAYDFLNYAGTKQIIVSGAGTVRACVFDHATNTFSKINMASLSGLGGHAFVPKTGGEQNNTLLVSAHNNIFVHKFSSTDVITGTAYSLPVGVNVGGHSVRVNTPTYPNAFLLFTNTATVQVFSETTPGWTPGYIMPIDVSNGVGDGASSFEVSSGIRQGQMITIRGGNRASLYAYDINAGSVPAQPANLSGSVNSGGMLLRQSGTPSFDQPVLLHGTGSLHATSIYNPTTGDFSIAGPITTGAIFGGSAQVFIPGGSNGGAFFIVNGSTMPSTSVYFPQNNTFSGTRMPGSVPNAGAHTVRIFGGANDGRTLIVAAGATRHTAIFDPIRHTMSAGPDTQNGVTTTGFSFLLTRGPYAGRILTFLGGGSFVFNVYDPPTNQFYSSSVLTSPVYGPFSAVNTGASAFPIDGSDDIMIIRGNGMLTQILNQLTGVVTAGNSTGFTVNSVSLNVQFRTSGGAVKQAIFTTADRVAIFDHTTRNFSLAILPGIAGSGMQMMVIPSGPEAGNILVVRGNNTADTYIINRDTLIVTGGPTIGVGACGNTVAVNAGAQLLPIPYGANAGKALLLVGGDTPTSCMYDPATNAFSAGPVTSTTGSPGYGISNGAVAFRTNGGLYPTSFVILSGANKNVWGTYVP